MTDWARPTEVLEKGNLLATITYESDLYTVVNHDERVFTTHDTFKDADVMKKWLEWAYPNADALKQ